MRVRAFIIIQAASLAQANTYAEQCDPVGGNHTFEIGLFQTPTNQTVPSHYWCSTSLTPAHLSTMESTVGQLPGSVITEYDLVSQTSLPWDTIESMGLYVQEPVSP